MKIRFIFFVLVLPLLTLGQESKNLAPGEKLNGRIREITYYRTYSVFRGITSDGKTQITGKDLFDSNGKLVQTSLFGNGEERIIFEIVDGKLKSVVSYFDLDGKPNPLLAKDFSASTGDPKQVGLCSNYTTRQERGPAENIDIDREICADGSVRRTVTTEFTADGRLFAERVEDAAGRSWQRNNHFSADGWFSGFTYTVNDPPRQYRQEITYSEETLDKEKNWLRCKTTAINLAIPGRISYEYLEERRIVYY